MTTINTAAYRGQGVNVASLNNDTKSILAATGLDWKLIQLPMAVVGKKEVRLVSKGKVNVRSDNGTVLSFSSSDYKPHQNAELVGMMSEFAKESGLTLDRVGAFEDGARIWASATSPRQQNAAKGDIVQMTIQMRSGHQPGIATTVSASALRLVCLNGATMRVAGGKAKFTHGALMSDLKVGQAREFVAAASEAFNRHMSRLQALYAVHTSRALDLTYLLQLLQPELLRPVAEKILRSTSTPAPWSNLDANIANRRLLNAILEKDSSRRVVEDIILDSGSRTLNAAIAAYDHQPGAALSRGTLAHAYNGVTHFNSNVRGRSDETGLESNYWGAAAKSSSSALDLAIEYTSALTATPAQTFAN